MFEWDPSKAALNRATHGVDFEEACTVFSDPNALTFEDEIHSGDEDRWITLGLSSVMRVLLVISTDRSDRIRLISARRANGPERKIHEHQT